MLLLEGEVPLRMKQTRVLDISALVPGLVAVTVPVACVEGRRWHHVSRAALGRDFANLPPRVRRTRAASVLRSAQATARYVLNLAEVWKRVQAVAAHHVVSAPMGSYVDTAQERGEEILSADRVDDAIAAVDEDGYYGAAVVFLEPFPEAEAELRGSSEVPDALATGLAGMEEAEYESVQQ